MVKSALHSSGWLWTGQEGSVQIRMVPHRSRDIISEVLTKLGRARAATLPYMAMWQHEAAACGNITAHQKLHHVYDEHVDPVCVTTEEADAGLWSFDKKTAMGHSRFGSESEELCKIPLGTYPLSIIFKRSLEGGLVLKLWKRPTVIPTNLTERLLRLITHPGLIVISAVIFAYEFQPQNVIHNYFNQRP